MPGRPRDLPAWLAAAWLAAVWLGIGAAQTSAVWLDVPFVRQEKDGCGSACISMVMQYWSGQRNEAVSEDANAQKIQKSLYSKEAEGIFGGDMQLYFQRAGFHTFVFKGEW